MKAAFFTQTDYKLLIQSYLKQHKKERGYQARLAKAAGCSPSFFSQALNSHIHLTPDQGAGMAEFWNLSPSATEYFLSLVHLARTNASSYKKYLLERITDLREKHSDISQHVNSQKLTSSSDELLYYSAWYWVAIHIVASIPRFQTPAAIASRLGLSTTQVEFCLTQLERMGMVTRAEGRWQTLPKSYHLPRESPLVGIHHTNWRQRALSNAQLAHKDSLHYSVVHSLSVADYEKLKEMLLDFIAKSKKLVEASPEQELVAIGIDCYRV